MAALVLLAHKVILMFQGLVDMEEMAYNLILLATINIMPVAAVVILTVEADMETPAE